MTEYAASARAGWRRMTPLGLLVSAGVFGLVLLGAGARSMFDRAGADGIKPSPSSAAADTGAKREVSRAYAKLPLRFEPNRGQTDPQVKFLSRGPGYSLFLTPREAVLALTSPKARSGGAAVPGRPHRSEKGAGTVVRMRAVGANPKPKLTAAQRLGGQSNYLRGNDPSKWSTGVPGYGRVSYRDIYPGVDLVYHGDRGGLEYDFVLAPGADPQTIALSFKGQRRLWVDRRGELLLDTAAGKLRQARPFIYQQVGSKRRVIEGGYSLQGKDGVGFNVGAYDRSRPLVIDPTLSYSTYLGGAGGEGYEQAFDIAVDPSGSAYVTGTTASSDFPTENAFQTGMTSHGDVFVTKFNAAGSALEYSTYLGGNGGEAGHGIAIDSSGSAYVTGYTDSSNFPTQNAFQSSPRPPDAFVAKLTPAGSALAYSTYLGGGGGVVSGENEIDGGNDIAVDASGRAYVTGTTYSDSFPTKNAFDPIGGGSEQEAFVAKLDPSKSGAESLVYSTYLKGVDNRALGARDAGHGIAVDASGSAYVTGATRSLLFPTKNAFQAQHAGDSDAFVTKFAPSGSSLEYSTFLGGSRQGDDPSNTGAGNDLGWDIAVDASGSAYVAGQTGSRDFPMKNAFKTTRSGVQDAFVTKLTPAGSAVDYSTFLGGVGVDAGFGVAVDPSGSAYVTGNTASSDFPTKDAVQSSPGGGRDAFLTKFTAAGSALDYSSFLGGTKPDDAGGVAVDASCVAHVAGSTESADFPTHTPFQRALSGPVDAFVAALAPDTVCRSSALPSVSVSDTTVTEGDSGQVNATFRLLLAASPAQPVSVDYATADDTAIAPGDYAQASGTVAFAAGETNKTVTVAVQGDQLDEPDERFLVDLSNAQGATVSDGQGVGTIADDDSPGGDLPPPSGGGAGGGGPPAGGTGLVPAGGPCVTSPAGAAKNVLALTSGNDTRNGTPGDDLIFAGTGDDVIDALAGDDCVDLGPGADRGQGGSGNDLVVGGEGKDRMSASAGNDRMRGDGGDDRMDGDGGKDRLFGQTGNDALFGGLGNDVLVGQSGRDRMVGSRGRDRINGGRGNDRLLGESSPDRIFSGSGKDRVRGGSGDDVLRGDLGNDRLVADTGRDRIFGGLGNDRILAADGQRDRIRCGVGFDRVVADRVDRVDRGSCERVRRVRKKRGFASVAGQARARGLWLGFSRLSVAPVLVEVFQNTVGSLSVGARRVAVFRDRSESFGWDGRAGRGRQVRAGLVPDGYYWVRHRIAGRNERADVRREAYVRRRGRFSRLAEFSRADNLCGLISRLGLSAPAFGGPTNKGLNVAFHLARRGNVTLQLVRGRRVLPTVTPRNVVRRTYTVGFSPRNRRRGNYQVRILARAGRLSARDTLLSRRL